jgi:triacylglycerol esterase/lipase EstA (alpha/beta hydrolase family)
LKHQNPTDNTKTFDAQGPGGEVALLVHGLWMTGLEMRWLGARLGECGYEVHYFRYSSLTKTPRESARELADFIGQLGCERVNIVAHSMGGVVVLNLFDLVDGLPEGRVRLLGSPVLGSGLARVVASHVGLRLLLGSTAPEGLTKAAPSWRNGRDLGIIAGTSSIGVGRIIGGLQGPNDGTVSVCETQLPGATDFITLEVNHMGMLFSTDVVKEACFFLHYGRFDQGGITPDNSLRNDRKETPFTEADVGVAGLRSEGRGSGVEE